MELTEELSELLSMVSALSVIGFKDHEILDILKEEKLSANEIDFLFEQNHEVKKWQHKLQPDVDIIIDKAKEHEDELILKLLKKNGVDEKLSNQVMGAAVLYAAIKELHKPMIEIIKSGSTEDEVIAAFKKQGIEGDYVPLLYRKLLSEVPADEIKHSKGYPAWMSAIIGIFWIYIGRELMDGDDSFTIIGYAFIIFGFFSIGRAILKLIKQKA